ncbi:F-box/kelch-repeat protein At1g15670 [Magnolia sinica]|uniref:F-box/kelch-repeat protein At1g15670 n=1 Tax=Magnolia sinica TaxID=86752 RepID=UPI0026585026|nr:F-box/kelch-repeat protein At1g15670 [Magnolia sinica]
MEEIIPGLPDELARECLIRVPYNRFCTVGAVCTRWKDEVESSEFHRLRKSSGMSRSVVALTQSEPSRSLGAVKHPAMPAYRLSLFEPGSGSWEQLPPVPGFLHGLPLFCQVAGAGRSVVVVGGWNPVTWGVSNDVYVYDLLSATWRCGTRMPGPLRSFFACASDSDSTVFVAGGHDVEKNALRSALAYDVTTDSWVPLPDMAKERDECKGLFQRGRFHVIGGYCTANQGRFEMSGETLCIDTLQWGPVEEDVLEVGTCPRTCAVSHQGDLYRCRGRHLVVKEADTWRVVSELPQCVRVGAYMVMWQGKLMVVGSERHGGPHVVYTWDLKRYTWTKMETPMEHVGHVQAGCCFEI